MMIELFGPPGAGKTTFARALADRLQDRGHLTELRLSYRPTETLRAFNAYGVGQHAEIHRLRRALLEMLKIARHPITNARDVKLAVHLLKLLPPTNVFASIRNSQYLSRLSHSWHQTSGAASVVLFDQGFVQAVCSLALRAAVANDTPIANALDYAPKSDLLVRLDAPLEILKARLRDRRGLQNAVEQLFELDLKTSLASIQMIDRLHALLLQGGRHVLTASSLDQHSLGQSLNMIEKEVVRKLQSTAQKSSEPSWARFAAPRHGGDRYG
jgi:thymidylate kinase